MKKPVIGALMVLILLFIAGCDGGTAKTLRISGIVTDSMTTLPIGGASVRAAVKGTTISQEKPTNSAGAYSIDLTGLKTGNVIQMLVYKSGYFTYGYDFTYTGVTSITINVLLQPSSTVDTINGYASLMNVIPPSASTGSILRTATVRHITPPEPTEVIIAPRSGIKPEGIERSLALKGTRIKSANFERGYMVADIPKGMDIDDFISQLQAEGWASYIEPNSYAVITAAVYPNDAYFTGYQWNMYATSMPYVWGMPQFGSAVTVAVLDTGVDVTHPDLAGRTLPPMDFVYPPDSPSYMKDVDGHGTHVAGVIGAIVNNGAYVAGMSNRSALILPVKVMNDSGGGDAVDIAEGIYAAADAGAKVISMSLGWSGGDYVATVANAINYAYNKGVTIVAAAGNDAPFVVDFPANQPNVVAVSSVDDAFALSDFSNYGPEVDFAAPGGRRSPGLMVYSLYPMDSGGIGAMAGTSMATPHVSALLAMMMQMGHSRESALYTMGYTAQFDERNPFDYGNGIINAYAALKDLTMDSAKFWLATLDGNPVPGLGYLGYANLDRSFTFNVDAVSHGDYFLRGWVDVNSDGLVNDGDFYGSQSVTIGSGANWLSGTMRLYIYPQSGTSKISAKGMQAVTLP